MSPFGAALNALAVSPIVSKYHLIGRGFTHPFHSFSLASLLPPAASRHKQFWLDPGDLQEPSFGPSPRAAPDYCDVFMHY